MIRILLVVSFMFGSSNFSYATNDLGEDYISAYKDFYPSKVLAMGMQDALFHFEDYSKSKVEQWIAFNKDVLRKLSNPSNEYVLENRINARLLRLQVQSELEQWERKAVHENSLTLYASLISNALEKIVTSNYLTPVEKTNLLCERLDDLNALCQSAISSLKSGQKRDFDRGLRSMKEAVEYFENELPELISNWPSTQICDNPLLKCQKTGDEIQKLIDHANDHVLPTIKSSDLAIGNAEYAKRLGLYTDSDLSPEQLEKMALEEIEVTKDLMLEVSKAYLAETYPTKEFRNDRDHLIRRALEDMEKDAPKDGEDYLSFWLELRDAAITFIKEKDIVTLPDFQTLRILNAPESAGPAARIGWVGVAPTFDPNPVTTLYLPSIPDTMPEQEQIDFWASFNKPFNRMIVIHELIPGHYHQKKVFRETPHKVRLFFPYSLYTEGYATFTERVLLDEGWEKERPLTYLAHLRKRLENANRAYTSVQMHCNNWTEEMVMEFSTQTSLLAPQFAKSLWGRISQRPMQVISYFLGGKQFSELFDHEKKRLGDQFVLKDFMDTILKVGPIPTDEYYTIFKDKTTIK